MTNQSQTTASAEMVLAVQQKVEDFKAIVSSAPEALTANMTMLEKAIAGVSGCTSFAVARSKGQELSQGGTCPTAILNILKKFEP